MGGIFKNINNFKLKREMRFLIFVFFCKKKLFIKVVFGLLLINNLKFLMVN